MNNLKKAISIKNLIIFLSLAFIVVCFYLVFGPIKPASYSSLTIKSKDVVAGQQLEYTIQYCRYVGSNVRASIVRSLVPVNSKLLPIPLSSDESASAKRCGTSDRELLLPSNLPAGWYNLRIVGVYAILPIRNVSIEIETSKAFYVKASPLDSNINSIQQQINNLQQELNNMSTPSDGISLLSSPEASSTKPSPSSFGRPIANSSNIASIAYATSTSGGSSSGSSGGSSSSPPPSSPPGTSSPPSKQGIIQTVITSLADTIKSLL